MPRFSFQLNASSSGHSVALTHASHTPFLAFKFAWPGADLCASRNRSYATALHLGTADTEAILQRFTRNNLQHPTYQALSELGHAIKTIFLCQRLESEELRREIHGGLNVIENWNSANSFIHYRFSRVTDLHATQISFNP